MHMYIMYQFIVTQKTCQNCCRLTTDRYPYHPSMVYLHLFTYIWLILMVNVGKYMDATWDFHFRCHLDRDPRFCKLSVSRRMPLCNGLSLHHGAKLRPKLGVNWGQGRVAEFYGWNMIFVVYIYIYRWKVSTWDLSEILRCEPIRSIQVSMCFFCSAQLVTVFSSHCHPIACLDRDSWLFDHLCSDLLISGDELSATGFIPKVLKSIGFIQCRAWGVPDFPLWQIITHIICIIFVIMIYFSSFFYIYCAYIYILCIF